MKPKILGLLAVGLLAGVMPAHATILRVDYGFTITSTFGGFPAPLGFSGVAFYDTTAADSNPGASGEYGLISHTVNVGGTSITPSVPTLGSYASKITIQDQVPYSTPVDRFGLSSTFNYDVGGINIRSIGFTLEGPQTIFSGDALFVVNPDDYSFRQGFVVFGSSTCRACSVSANLSTISSTAVPEPGTLALLGLGLAGLGLSRRRKAA